IMADVNLNAPANQAPTMTPPTRTDNQILPHIRWAPIGKINYYLDIESAKGTKREVFGMPIPGNLIIADIQGSDPDSPTPKPTKATKKSKPSAPKIDLRPPVTKPASSRKPKPKPAPAKSQGKKLIFQRRTSTPTESSGHDESSSLYAKLGLIDSEMKSDEDVPRIDVGVQDEGQP
nr:hypothetical protein [Tanacetum cinerariifolium]